MPYGTVTTPSSKGAMPVGGIVAFFAFIVFIVILSLWASGSFGKSNNNKVSSQSYPPPVNPYGIPTAPNLPPPSAPVQSNYTDNVMTGGSTSASGTSGGTEKKIRDNLTIADGPAGSPQDILYETQGLGALTQAPQIRSPG